MNRAHKVSGRAWLILSASVLLCSAVWFVTHRWRPILPDTDGEFAALASERDQLRGNDDHARDTLREQRKVLARQAWTTEAIAGLQRSLGADWRWEWEPGGRPHRAVLQRTAPRLEEWPHYVSLVAELARLPGVAVDSVEFRADGAAWARRFTRAAIGLRFTVADAPLSDAERAAPGRGALPLAPAGDPATSRQVGAVPSLRTPSASAEPPAPGPASTSFRSDPPGPKAGISPPTTPTNP